MDPGDAAADGAAEKSGGGKASGALGGIGARIAPQHPTALHRLVRNVLRGKPVVKLEPINHDSTSAGQEAQQQDQQQQPRQSPPAQQQPQSVQGQQQPVQQHWQPVQQQPMPEPVAAEALLPAAGSPAVAAAARARSSTAAAAAAAAGALPRAE